MSSLADVLDALSAIGWTRVRQGQVTNGAWVARTSYGCGEHRVYLRRVGSKDEIYKTISATDFYSGVYWVTTTAAA